ncbi:hypothetical protein D9M68_374560 [compost metagenome]
MTDAPRARKSDTVASNASAWISASTSFMPSAAPISANAFPKPDAAPVITATRSFKSFMA